MSRDNKLDSEVVRATTVAAEAAERSDESAAPLPSRPGAFRVGLRTLWSLLSSLALHSAVIATLLLVYVVFRQPEPLGVAEFETVVFTEDNAERGGAASEVSQAGLEDRLEEKDQAVERPEAVRPEERVDVSKTVAGARAEELAESEEVARESAEGLKTLERLRAAGLAANASDEAVRARSLQSRVAALEARLSAAKKKLIANRRITLPRPGQDTDGSALFSTIGSNKVIFIIDISGSMQAPIPVEDGGTIRALDYIKLELAGLIKRQLGGRTRFNIIAFSNQALPWQRRLVRASVSGKKEATGYVQDLQAAGGTNLHAALAAAFQDPDVREIYVLSDGMPTLGLGGDQLLAFVKAQNQEREVRINTIAFIVNEGPRAFLARLAEQNNGRARAFP